MTGAKFSSAFETYSMPYGIISEIRNHYSEATLSLEDTGGRKIDIVLRAFDDGVAFRYDYTAEIYADGSDAAANAESVEKSVATVTSKDTMKIRMAPGGGHAVRFYQAK